MRRIIILQLLYFLLQTAVIQAESGSVNRISSGLLKDGSFRNRVIIQSGGLMLALVDDDLDEDLPRPVIETSCFSIGPLKDEGLAGLAAGPLGGSLYEPDAVGADMSATASFNPPGKYGLFFRAGGNAAAPSMFIRSHRSGAFDAGLGLSSPQLETEDFRACVSAFSLFSYSEPQQIHEEWFLSDIPDPGGVLCNAAAAIDLRSERGGWKGSGNDFRLSAVTGFSGAEKMPFSGFFRFKLDYGREILRLGLFAGFCSSGYRMRGSGSIPPIVRAGGWLRSGFQAGPADLSVRIQSDFQLKRPDLYPRQVLGSVYKNGAVVRADIGRLGLKAEATVSSDCFEDGGIRRQNEAELSGFFRPGAGGVNASVKVKSGTDGGFIRTAELESEIGGSLNIDAGQGCILLGAECCGIVEYGNRFNLASVDAVFRFEYICKAFRLKIKPAFSIKPVKNQGGAVVEPAVDILWDSVMR